MDIDMIRQRVMLVLNLYDKIDPLVDTFKIPDGSEYKIQKAAGSAFSVVASLWHSPPSLRCYYSTQC